jgi:cobyrinic acid a,c-diamide synthase
MKRDSGLTAAVPMDDAFCFYYRENIECMEASGIRIRYFSPLKGDPLPDADIYYLGGGYPELYLERLSQNRDFFQGLKTASDDGKVVLGECGGMLALCNSIGSGDTVCKASGIFNADVKMTKVRHGPAYVVARSNGICNLFDGTVKGHEFHYSEVYPAPDCRFGFDVIRGAGISDHKDGLVRNNTLGTYMHQHALSTDDWMGKIIEICR